MSQDDSKVRLVLNERIGDRAGGITAEEVNEPVLNAGAALLVEVTGEIRALE